MIIAANFKTNHTRESTKSYLEEVSSFIELKYINTSIRVFPPFTAFSKVDLPENIKIGAQNFYPVKKGSITGEIGKEQLDEFDIKSVLIGHSERRVLLKESMELISRKFTFAKEEGMEIIFCIGEPKEIRDIGIEAVMEYLFSQFTGIDIDYKNLIVAYEPIWAIGTGVSATQEDVKEVLDALRIMLKNTPLLYGGSVNKENIDSIVSLKNCDGVLVGSASLEAANFCALIKAAKE